MNQSDEEIRAVPFDERFRDASWVWLQDPGLHRIIDARRQTRDEQLTWFEALPQRTDYFIWGVEYGGLPVAVFGLKNFGGDGTAEWFMYIGTQEFRGRGIGDWIETAVEGKARERGLREIWGWVRPDNEYILTFVKRHGYDVGPVETNGRRRCRKQLSPT